MISERFLSAEGLLRFVEDAFLILLPGDPVESIYDSGEADTMMAIPSFKTECHSHKKGSRTFLCASCVGYGSVMFCRQATVI